MRVPERLQIRGRPTLTDFQDDERFFREYALADLDEHGMLSPGAVWAPDFSVNWSRFSRPSDVFLRPNSSPEAGCYSFSVLDARADGLGYPVHEPVEEGDYENYAHVEIRAAYQDANAGCVPPKRRKLGAENKLRYRLMLREAAVFEIAASS